MTVGERIRNRRIELGLSQEDLAIKMGYSGKSSVCKAETCKDNITTTKVMKYAEALSCSFEYLMGWEDEIDESEKIGVPDFSEEHIGLIELYSSLTPEKQKIALNLLETLKNS